MEKITIRRAMLTDRSGWDRYVMARADATAYQLFPWGRAVRSGYGFENVCLLAENEGKVCGVLPAIHIRVPGAGSRLVSLPYCDSGGVLSDNEAIARALMEKALDWALDRRCSYDIRSTVPLPFAGDNLTDKVRMVLELPDSSAKLLAAMKSKLRSQVQKPSREGMTARIGGGELVPQFYRVFGKNMRDLGSPVHGRRWIESVVEEYAERARVGVVYTPDGVPAAAGIVLMHSETVSIPWASSLRQYNNLSPNMLLYWTFLAYAADNGFKRFDFGRSSPGEGTWRFKEQWGAEPNPLFWYQFDKNGNPRARPMTPGARSRSRMLVESVWSRLPVPVANLVGPKIRKYISL
jgi:FemAB-related protein (PEP-CTERM system-associated)